MYIRGIQSYDKTYYSNPQSIKRVSFEGIKSIDLNYVLQNRAYLLPERVSKKAIEIVQSGSSEMPTLKQVHQDIYAPLLECKTLDEVKEIFPEFSGVKEVHSAFQRNGKNIKKLKKNGTLENNLSLKLLQDVWAKLKPQDEIVRDLGLAGKSGLGWILKKIGFVNYGSNYRTILMSSDPEGRALIAAKTTAWNAAHPDLMYKKNKHAAQFCKTPEYRKAHSERMIEYDKSHPERREKIRDFYLAVWAKVPEVRNALSEFAKAQDSYIRSVIMKDLSKSQMTLEELRIKKNFYKKFWNAHPDLKMKYKEAFKQVKEERALQKNEKP